MKAKELIKKANRVWKEEGVGMLVRKTRLYLKSVASGQKHYSDSEIAWKSYRDVLFINGCYLEHPSRYRVAHQREQLEAGNLTTAQIFYKELSLELVKNFRIFIFFRCPYTEEIGEFIVKARQYKKIVLFDIDDLMIDTQYTNLIPYVQQMKTEERKLYEDGVIATGKLLKMCDGAITTTEALAEELKKFVPSVYINRNTASEEMIGLSEKAIREKTPKEGITIGYFSGSITHNTDFELIVPALLRIMEKHQETKLLIAGELELPEPLRKYQNRIVKQPMRNWRQLPQLIASVDINIAPLQDTVFNRAKSENKWVEAALVKVPTIASDVGAFHHMIQNNITGVLCKNTEEAWFDALELLLADERLRDQIAENAYNYARQNCTTVYQGAAFADYIYKKMSPNIVFILPVIQISGGALVTLKHAAILQDNGIDVTIFNEGYEKDIEIEEDGRKFPVISEKTIQIKATIDKCVATLWSTCQFFENYGKIKERYYLVQNYETDFYQPGDPLRIRANATYQLRMPVKYITISRWCQQWLAEKYNCVAEYAPNGLDIERFYPQERDFSGKIRILVEGNSEDYYKNVDESFRITNELNSEKFEVWYMSYQGKPKDWYRVDQFFHKVPYNKVPDIYRQCHILIKSSLLESFSYPPLEMMATGGCVIVAPNGGNMEYLRNGENCLFYNSGNVQEALQKIEMIVKDAALRKKLMDGGIQTGYGRQWERIQESIALLYFDELKEKGNCYE